jgi:hypothetical protein
MPHNADEQITFGDLSAAKFVGHFVTRAKIFHSHYAYIVARLKSKKDCLAIVMQIAPGRT